MKRIISVFLCYVLIFSSTVIYAHAGADYNNVTEKILADLSIEDSREKLGFVNGANGTYTFEFVYYIYDDKGFVDEDIQYEYIEYTCTYINVPYTSNKVEAKMIKNDFSEETIELWDDLMQRSFPDTEQKRSASYYYNCHSYAWYSTSTSNFYWIDFPEEFYQDNCSYEEVTTPAVGDIICYYAADGTNLHSGIVTAVNVASSNGMCGNSNTVNVISKWGLYGLYEHNGYECPYTTYVQHTVDNPPATTVRYFRYHAHAFSYININTNYQHRATCRTCGYTFVESHSWKILLDGSQKCLKCGVTTTGHVILSVEEYSEHE